MSKTDLNKTPESGQEFLEETPGGSKDLNRQSGSGASSPHWGVSTKMVVGLSVVAVFAFLLFRFLNLVGPLLLAFILAYLFYPMADWSKKYLKLPWRASVTILYLILVVLLLSSITVGGLTMVEQIQNLIGFLTKAVNELPTFITNITSHPWQIGPFTLDLALLDVNNLSQQILGVVQPLLTQAGTSVVSVAGGAASFIGWTFFILLVSYFILAESGGFHLFSVSLPGYDDDMHRLSVQLGRIWNAFLRGQLTIGLLTVTIYMILLGILGVKFFFGLALLAGLARFIPYVGPFIAWTSYGLVAFFQGSTIFGVSPLIYVAIVVGSAWITDMLMDNFVSPRVMSNALRVHPAAVMVSALMAFNLLGVVGMVLAAPVLATTKLFLEYIFAKLFDRDPWEGIETIPPSPSFAHSYRQVVERIQVIRNRIMKSNPAGEK